MSSCSRSASVLSYLMGELTEAERALFEKHLDSCPICRHELGLEHALQHGLVECTLPDAAPAELRLNVLSRIMTLRQPRLPVWQIAVTVLAGAAASLVLLRILSGSSLPETGIGLLTGFIEGATAVIGKAGSLPLMIGVGVVFVGIASVVASLVPED